MFQDKFNELKIKIAEGQDHDVSPYGNLNQQQLQMLNSGRFDKSVINGLISSQLPTNIIVSIDFTKLAKIADSMKKKNLANFLIK